MKKFIVVFVSLILSGLIVFGLPLLTGEEKTLKANNTEESVLTQNVLSFSDEEKAYYKLYNDGQLVCYITDYDKIKNAIAKEYKYYEDRFPNTELGFVPDIYVTREKNYAEFEDVDDKLIEYLINNKLLGIKTNAVEFSTSDGVYDIIYVKNIDDFTNARSKFLLNFVSEDTIKKLNLRETINDPFDFGTVEKNLKIQETITYGETIVSPSVIFTDEATIYEYLCYGRNTEREYYITEEGDTLQGVGNYRYGMTAKQLVMLNPDVLSNEQQILEPGLKLNVTYFDSPITVVVTKERLAEETITPASPVYIEDASMAAGSTKIITEEEPGSKNVLYEETWINGVLQSGEVKSQVITKEPIQGEIAMGTKSVNMFGSGSFIWPVDNPSITCGWGCYAGHEGTDIQPMYDRFGPVYASDSGVVLRVGYDPISGNFLIIDHQNGLWSYYGHMNQPAFVSEGQSVSRGQVVGQVGMTGLASGPHVHFMIYVDGVKVNACGYLDCYSVPNF